MADLNKSLDKALELNPDNPRVYYLRAIITLHTPETFGGGASKALPLFRIADEKFKIFVPKTSISPNWGKELNEIELIKLDELLKQ